MNTPASPPPQVIMSPTVIGEAGETAQTIVKSLGASPVLLMIVMLNLAMCGAAGWFLLTQEGYRHDERLEFIQLFKTCMVGFKDANPESH